MRMPRLLEVNMIKQLIPAKCMRIGFLRYQAAYQFLVQKSYSTIEAHSQQQEVVIAIGSNPQFLNSAVRGVTSLGSHELLQQLKKIEKDMGRTDGIWFGTRPIDLDILFYWKFGIRSYTLTVPHERLWERPFVMAPNLLGLEMDNDTVASWQFLWAA
ncbi:hypothetical protein SAY87_013889 [Trapa incisa]|uniref:2-amino-4-hydroxy-6-hydroxymethyldihydropteridine diphosphokinase n=1 Tax=Trapa incisa TaxID=236973 RepID=A0AAN7KI29_9MYRT|nr:hypothetical protein SAY87_013889 [Trapa incisa]